MITMKRLLALSLVFGMFAFSAHAINWWNRPTICQPVYDTCAPMGTPGWEMQFWDVAASCWGVKMVCGDALVGQIAHEVPFPSNSQMQVQIGFDITEFDAERGCFGVRAGGTEPDTVNCPGGDVRIWCPGILGDLGFFSASRGAGEYSCLARPTCADLASVGVVAIRNNNCWGVRYVYPEFFIECVGDSELPRRIIRLNGADWRPAPAGGGPIQAPPMGGTRPTASDIFQRMREIATDNRNRYFR